MTSYEHVTNETSQEAGHKVNDVLSELAACEFTASKPQPNHQQTNFVFKVL